MSEPADQASRRFALLDGGWRDLEFTPFRDGIEAHWIAEGEPAAAILRYAPGASVPRHSHPGFETILVLDGAQVDDFGVSTAGDYVVNAPGSAHAVSAPEGCVVLVTWEKQVVFL